MPNYLQIHTIGALRKYPGFVERDDADVLDDDALVRVDAELSVWVGPLGAPRCVYASSDPAWRAFLEHLRRGEDQR